MRWERPDWGPEVQWNLPIKGTNCMSLCILHREVYLIQRWIMFILLVLQTVSSIERCPSFTFLYRLHCIHIAIQIPLIYRLHCTHTPLSHIALSSLLAHLLLVFRSCRPCFNHWCTQTHTQCQLGGVQERSYREEQEFLS